MKTVEIAKTIENEALGQEEVEFRFQEIVSRMESAITPEEKIDIQDMPVMKSMGVIDSGARHAY